MAKEYIDYKEAIELFVYSLPAELKSESKTPKINIIFPECAFKLFEYVRDNPFTKDGYIVPDITDEEIEKLKPYNQQDETVPSIYVKDPVRFFELLAELINTLIDYKAKYYRENSGRAILIHEFKNLLIRMNVSDFTNVEHFLAQQIDFLKDNTWDDYIIDGEFISSCHREGTFENYQILSCKEYNASYCETSEKISFALYDEEHPNENIQTIPSILYGIREEDGKKVCYIYAIQNPNDSVNNKKIARKLYKLNKGVENPNVHPSQVLALKTFIEMLTKIGITDIKVPCLQVLNYRYHQILSRNAKKTMEKWTPKVLEDLRKNETSYNKRKLSEYKWDKEWASRVIDREDDIEFAKTEGLYNIFSRVAEQFDLIEFLSDPFIEDEYINIRIKSVKKLSKSI